MREEFVPTMLAEAMVWPPYMAFVFSRVPVKHQLLAVNIATLFDVCFLSCMRTKDLDCVSTEAEAPTMKAISTQEQQHHGRQLQLPSDDGWRTQMVC